MTLEDLIDKESPNYERIARALEFNPFLPRKTLFITGEYNPFVLQNPVHIPAWRRETNIKTRALLYLSDLYDRSTDNAEKEIIRYILND
jgi:hypothetical protein